MDTSVLRPPFSKSQRERQDTMRGRKCLTTTMIMTMMIIMNAVRIWGKRRQSNCALWMMVTNVHANWHKHSHTRTATRRKDDGNDGAIARGRNKSKSPRQVTGIHWLTDVSLRHTNTIQPIKIRASPSHANVRTFYSCPHWALFVSEVEK